MLVRPRHTHIQYQVLKLLRSLPENLLCFPLDVKSIIKTIDKCKVASYKNFAKTFGVSVDDVITLCSSKTGCTHYDVATEKYLILYNNSFENHNVDGRQLWTLAHELAHVVLQHPLMETEDSVAENSFFTSGSPVIESEADYFATQLLAPFPLFGPLNITSPVDIEHMFGLSTQASLTQFSKYQKWKGNHIKNSFENDLQKLFLPFISTSHY